MIQKKPTYSRALYVQMVGRGLRPYPGKSDCLVVDMADLCRQPQAYSYDDRCRLPPYQWHALQRLYAHRGLTAWQLASLLGWPAARYSRIKERLRRLLSARVALRVRVRYADGYATPWVYAPRPAVRLLGPGPEYQQYQLWSGANVVPATVLELAAANQLYVRLRQYRFPADPWRVHPRSCLTAAGGAGASQFGVLVVRLFPGADELALGCVREHSVAGGPLVVVAATLPQASLVASLVARAGVELPLVRYTCDGLLQAGSLADAFYRWEGAGLVPVREAAFAEPPGISHAPGPPGGRGVGEEAGSS